MKFLRRIQLTGIIGNIIGHYDTALYGLLAPFLAPLFFEDKDPLTALILTYAIMPLGLISKPLGALFFGRIGNRFGHRQAFLSSLLGMAIITGLIGCLPIYSRVGSWAPCFLVLTRCLQSFCAAGESTGASILILENTPSKHRTLQSSFFDASSMMGVLIASGLVTLFYMKGWMDQNWRMLFWIGSFAAFFGLLLRSRQVDIAFKQTQKQPHLFLTIYQQRKPFLALMLASGFSYSTYALVFTLMNGYVPLITSFTKTDLMKINTPLLALDMILLPCFGWLAQRYGKSKLMMGGAFGLALLSMPLFCCLKGASLLSVGIIRFIIVICGVAFAAPFHAWKLDRVLPEHRFTILSLSCTLGSQLVGVSTSFICLWLYQKLNYVWAPSLYLILIGSVTGAVIYTYAKAEKKALKEESLRSF